MRSYVLGLDALLCHEQSFTSLGDVRVYTQVRLKLHCVHMRKILQYTLDAKKKKATNMVM